MAETSQEIRRELEQTRARMGSTIAALERKLNPRHALEEHPIAAVGAAFGTGVLLATTGSAARAARGVKEEVNTHMARVNSHAGGAMDALLHAVMSAASTAISAKVSGLLDAAAPSAPDGHGHSQDERVRALRAGSDTA